MGLLTDFFIATDSAVAALAEDALPAQHFVTAQLKGVDPVKIDLLYALLSDQPVDEVIETCVPVRDMSDDGPWIFRLPSELVSRLAELDSSKVESVSQDWGKFEEFEGWSPSEVLGVLEALVSISRRAAAPAQSVYQWVCL